MELQSLFPIDFPIVLIRKSKGNGPRSFQAYFLLISFSFDKEMAPGAFQTYSY